MTVITANEVLFSLERFGFSASTKTLMRYEKEGLIPKAERTYGGYCVGKITQYANTVPAQFYASYRIVNQYYWRVKLEKVGNLRKLAISLEENLWDIDSLSCFINENLDKMDAIWRWLGDKARIEEQIFDYEYVGVEYELNNGRLIRSIIYPDRVGQIHSKIRII